MNNYYKINWHVPENDMENMYPDVYKELYPFVIDAANDLMRRGMNLTDELLNSTVDNIIKNCGLWDEDADSNMQPVSVQQQFRRPMRRHHNRNSLRDVLRILLLREFLEGRR